MLFMVIERFKDQDARAVYRRLRDDGRGVPEGLPAAANSHINTSKGRFPGPFYARHRQIPASGAIPGRKLRRRPLALCNSIKMLGRCIRIVKAKVLACRIAEGIGAV